MSRVSRLFSTVATFMVSLGIFMGVFVQFIRGMDILLYGAYWSVALGITIFLCIWIDRLTEGKDR